MGGFALTTPLLELPNQQIFYDVIKTSLFYIFYFFYPYIQNDVINYVMTSA